MNFFGNVRSFGARNVSPNCVGFEGAFKALLLNNYNSPHSIQSNCEKDENECLKSLKFLIKEKLGEEKASDAPKKDLIVLNEEIMNPQNYTGIDAGQGNYVCGWVLDKCLKNVIKTCKHCRMESLFTQTNRS